MGNISIKSDSAEYTGKFFIDIKSIRGKGISIKNNVEGPARLFGNFCCESQAIAGSHGNDAKIYRYILQCAYNSVNCAISTANHDIRDCISFYDLLKIIITPVRLGRKYFKVNSGRTCFSDDEIF